MRLLYYCWIIIIGEIKEKKEERNKIAFCVRLKDGKLYEEETQQHLDPQEEWKHEDWIRHELP